MILTGTLDLPANRYTPLVAEIAVTGVDLTGAVIAAQVRDGWNGGTLRADLTDVADPADQGVAVISTAVIDGVTVSLLSLRLDEATMEAMPADSADPDGDVDLVWDMQCTPVGEDKAVFLRGKFTVRAGSTQ